MTIEQIKQERPEIPVVYTGNKRPVLTVGTLVVNQDGSLLVTISKPKFMFAEVSWATILHILNTNDTRLCIC